MRYRRKPLTISGKICEAIKTQIASGIYVPGSSLPSTRALSIELGVARSTVTVAFEQLAAEGYLQVSQGSRARVAFAIQQAAPSKVQSFPRVSVATSDFAKRLHAFTPFDRFKGLAVDFRSGDLAGADFPGTSWRRAVAATLRKSHKTLQYDDPLGVLTLRKSLSAYLWRSRGVRCDASQIVVVNGSQQGIDLCARLLLNSGDKAVVEDPGYMLVRNAFEAIGASIVPIPADEDGLRTALLRGVDAKLAYVTPSHQFPLGGVLPVNRRQELLEWSSRTEAFIIEDDYDGEYRYDMKPTETLHSLDQEGRVLYLGTMSKILSPGLRLGYLVIPEELSMSFSLAKRLTDRHSALLQQHAFQILIDSGALERHVRKVRRANDRRRATLLSQIEQHLPDQVSVQGTKAGLHVVAWMNHLSTTHESSLIEEAAKLGLGLYGMRPLYSFADNPNNANRAGLVLGYAGLTEAQIGTGIRLLAKLLTGFQTSTSLPYELPRSEHGGGRATQS